MQKDIEETITVGDVKLWTTFRGKDFPTLLINGGPGCCDYMMPVAEMIEDISHVIRYEQRGCGRSNAGSTFSIENCITDIEEIRKHYRSNK